MKRAKLLTFATIIAIFVLACCALTACDPVRNTTLPDVNLDVVKAFNAISPTGDIVTQTATATGDKFLVTVITTEYVAEYTLDKNFKIENKEDVVGNVPSATTAAEEKSALEKAYAEALSLSEIAPDKVTGFDFDFDTYMGKNVYKAEIEELGTKYEFVFDANDFTLLKSEIEFEKDLPTGSYISEQTAYALALEAAGATNVEGSVVRCELEDGRKIFKVSFNFASYRYDISVDAVKGDIVKFSKSAIEDKKAPADAQNITAEQAKAIALQFVFPNGEEPSAYVFRKVKIDREDGQFVYEVELSAKNAEYEFDIDANGGKMLDVEIEGVKPQTELPADKRFITRDQAIAAVKKVAGNNIYVLEVEIDKEDGKYFYEIEARGADGVKREYKVDALSGVVLGNSSPTDAVIAENEAVLKALQAFDLNEQAVERKIVKLEMEDGSLRYSVKLYANGNEYEAEIDATTGEVLKRDVEEDRIPPATEGGLTRDQAVAKLKEHLGNNAGAVFGEVELEYENGKYVYEIEVVIDGRECDYFVDATTGAVSRNSEFVSGGSEAIAEEQALALTLKFFKLEGRESEIKLRKIKLEYDDFRLIYDVEFYLGNLKYEVELDAVLGTVLESDVSYD